MSEQTYAVGDKVIFGNGSTGTVVDYYDAPIGRQYHVVDSGHMGSSHWGAECLAHVDPRIAAIRAERDAFAHELHAPLVATRAEGFQG